MSEIKKLLPHATYCKANLHTHSTISDGKLSPQEVKQAYKALGYQILAITDHNIIVDHSDMSEPDFLMLTGTEINFNHKNYRPRFDGQVYHFNLIAKKPDNLWFPGVPETRFPNSRVHVDKMRYEGMSTFYSAENANAMIAKANEMGFLVMYNHPTWSCQSYPDYAPLKGLWAVEQRNSECYVIGNREDNARVIRDLRNLGNRVYPTGTDDMHTRVSLGQAWIMVGAPALNYDAVITALENGDFYMSCGPEIHSLQIDGNILKVTCSDARRIALESHGRFACSAFAEDGNWLRKAEFDITRFLDKADDENMYLHLTVTAPDGTYAATRAYYLSEVV